MSLGPDWISIQLAIMLLEQNGYTIIPPYRGSGPWAPRDRTATCPLGQTPVYGTGVYVSPDIPYQTYQ